MINSNGSSKIRDYLLKDNNIINLIDKVHAHYPVESNYEGIKFESECVQSGMIFKSTKSNGVKDILIHVKVGEPSTDQVCDSVYRYSDDVRERIIVFTGGSNYLDQVNPTADRYVIYELIEKLNLYPLTIYMVFLDAEELMSGKLSLEVIQGPPSSVQRDMDSIPDEDQFRDYEFWNIYYDHLNEGFYCPNNVFSTGFPSEKEFGYYIEGSYADIYVDWIEEGFLFRAVSKDGCDDFVIHKSYQLMKAEQFPTSEIKINYKPHDCTEVELVSHPISSSMLRTANPLEKVAYAKLLQQGLDKFHSYFEQHE